MPGIYRTEPFERWIKGLKDQRGRAKILTRLDRLTLNNPGDVRWIGDGVSEMRIDFGPGYRIYYTRHGNNYVMLVGGDKSTQKKDIRRAIALAKELDDDE
jgi:putative addiction module killer protein